MAASSGQTRTVADGRGNAFVIASGPFVDNLRALRDRLHPGTEVWQVAKGNGYGMGLDVALWLGQTGGVDGYCVGTVAEARRIREIAADAPVLVFTSCTPAQLPAVAALGVIVTVNSVESYEALASQKSPASFMLELDCGFGRYGLDPEGVRHVRERLRECKHLRCVGAYTHFGMAADRLVHAGTRRFDDMVTAFAADGPLLTMVASSETAIRFPTLTYSAVDPGRVLYGLVGLDEPGWGIQPVVQCLTSSLAQVTVHQEQQELRIGYGEPRQVDAGMKTGVFPLGWHDGLSADTPYGVVLVDGQVCEVLARTLLHSIVDLSSVYRARVGDPVVIFDNGGDLPLEVAARAQGETALRLHLRVLGSISACAESD